MHDVEASDTKIIRHNLSLSNLRIVEGHGGVKMAEE